MNELIKWLSKHQNIELRIEAYEFEPSRRFYLTMVDQDFFKTKMIVDIEFIEYANVNDYLDNMLSHMLKYKQKSMEEKFSKGV